MANRSVLACVDETCRQIMQSTLPFGGKVVVLLGNFWQTCPVIHGGTKMDIINASISRSTIWSVFNIYHLTTPIRNTEDDDFAKFVNAIGDGRWPCVSFEGLSRAGSISDLTQFVFPDHVIGNPTLCLKRNILAPKNSQVDTYNSAILDRLPGPPTLFCTADSLEEHSNALADSERDVLPTPDAILDYVAKV